MGGAGCSGHRGLVQDYRGQLLAVLSLASGWEAIVGGWAVPVLSLVPLPVLICDVLMFFVRVRGRGSRVLVLATAMPAAVSTAVSTAVSIDRRAVRRRTEGFLLEASLLDRRTGARSQRESL